jgi:hypothetical protein
MKIQIQRIIAIIFIFAFLDIIIYKILYSRLLLLFLFFFKHIFDKRSFAFRQIYFRYIFLHTLHLFLPFAYYSLPIYLITWMLKANFTRFDVLINNLSSFILFALPLRRSLLCQTFSHNVE